ncbi:hypothetical protein SAMN04488542_10563 [Fontibacillus panacisegetis]|uniref:Phage transcriptional activator, RinA family n=1 Tax=Fontibacillus panacisegetis TaxID=670482 RepID=A0A1G7HWS0_9BACL|nr:hypothetical protein [Fontibacillus panacisegetis]SDF04835.1 hypothetical protein SAMN04488542_10563 [Fontibacillus panacisegetis]
MPPLDKKTEETVVSLLSEVNLALFLERSNDQVSRILELVEKMPELEREVITRRYLSVNANYTSHQEIYRGMGISSPFYTKIRRSAIGKIAAEFGSLS